MSETVQAPTRYNFKHIQGSFYVVRTQAGLKRAIKHYSKHQQLAEVDSPVHADKLSYPAVVAITAETWQDCPMFRVSAVHINRMASAISGE